jgi:hypothetical protein
MIHENKSKDSNKMMADDAEMDEELEKQLEMEAGTNVETQPLEIENNVVF